MLDCFLHVWTEHCSVLGHFRGKRVRILPVRHEVRPDQPRRSIVLLHGIADRTAKSLPFDDLADHGIADRMLPTLAPIRELTAEYIVHSHLFMGRSASPACRSPS